MRNTKTLCVLVVAPLLWCSPSLAGVIYVDDDAPGGDGTTWQTAYQDLQSALTMAGVDDEIRIAQGVYRPAGPNGDRQVAFLLPSGVAVRGGYAGLTGEYPDDRNVNEYETILTGDLNGDDQDDFVNYGENSHHVVVASHLNEPAELDGVTVTGGYADGACCFYNRGAGVYVVDSNVVVRNCKIIANTAPEVEGAYTVRGGGMYIVTGREVTIIDTRFERNVAWEHGGAVYVYNVNPTFTGCTFTNNSAGYGGAVAARGTTINMNDCRFEGNTAIGGGGAFMVWSITAATFTDCWFVGNTATDTGRGRGGAIINWYNTTPASLVGCGFLNNTAAVGGGAVCNYDGGSSTLTRCSFWGNEAPFGGAILNDNQYGPIGVFEVVTSTDCLFSGNYASIAGGAMFDLSDVLNTITNCTLVNNEAGQGGCLCVVTLEGSVTRIENSIVYGNLPDQFYDDDASGLVTAAYSCISGGWPGDGNIDADPMLVNPLGPDGVAGTDDDNLRPAAGSPCIDAANSTLVPADIADLDQDGDTGERTPLDFDLQPRFVDDSQTQDTGIADPPDCPEVVDMGAYEFRPVGDCDGDGDVDVGDLQCFTRCLAGPDVDSTSGCEGADINDDGDVDLGDFAVFQQSFGDR